MASTNSPIRENHHSGLRPTRSDSPPAIGRNTSMATWPTTTSRSASPELMLIVPCR